MSLFSIYMRAMRLLVAEGWKVAGISAANVALAVIMIAEPILFGEIIQSISAGTDLVSRIALWAGLGCFNIIALVLVARGADRLAHKRRSGVLTESFEQVMSMPMAWHHGQGTSQVLHTLLRAIETLFTLWLGFMRQHLATVVTLVLLVPTALTLDWRMALVLAGLGACYVAINRLVMNRTKAGQAQVEQHYHRVFSHVADSIGNVSVMQSYGRVAQEAEALRRFTDDLLKSQYPVLTWWALGSALQRLAATLSMMIVLIIGAMLVQRGEMRIGDIVAFTGFAGLLIGRLDQVTGFFNEIFEARARLEPFFALKDAVSERADSKDGLSVDRLKGHVSFDNVSFTFPGSGEGVHNISFEVPAGKTVAIVGPTGAGKTTMINLLQRVFDPDSGSIRIDGIDVRDMTRRSHSNQIAAVFQEAGLLNRSIEENIRIGKNDACNDEVHEAAQAAAAMEFILSKREGYDTLVGERGAQLSGGERQRIAIARAVLKDAPILVLDEATSALDVETEQLVKSAIDRLRKDRTTFIIAHRLSTVCDADLVIFVDHGRIVEFGGFQQLADRDNGRFAALLRAGGLLSNKDRLHAVGQQPLSESA
ncbi:glucan ABC transporter ATP-binding protein/ permease [Hoeflea sp.]|uniref:glucan ABC transporter ATP-binding protein/ permease n=1 Tax=Hoeflea sp. TaxID=1940281 RepID=UPI0019A886BA|nr:glucan ABC transporter ATP-binding protein/ permease [Hoeflea sp.]MBC7282176.1 glucan ABC transporter ATP-binding protein/ permease [Hoeflea sp.]